MFISDVLSSAHKVKILKALIRNPMTSNQIIEATGVSSSSLSTIIRRFVLMGIVESLGTVENQGVVYRGKRPNIWGLTE